MKTRRTRARKIAWTLCITVAASAIAAGVYLLTRDEPPPSTAESGRPVANPTTTASRQGISAVPKTELAPLPPDPIAPLTSHDNPDAPSARRSTVVATVEGQPISSDEFRALLMTASGLKLFEQVSDLVLVEQACAKAGINFSDPAFQQTFQSELDRSATALGLPALPPPQRAAALQQVLHARGISEAEFQMTLRMNACFRTLAKRKVIITDKMVNDAFNAEYGERLHGRLFIVRTLEEASDIRRAIIEQARDINEVAAICNARNYILPMSSEDEGVARLKNAARYMVEKQLSSAIAQPDGTYILFYLEKKQIARDDVNLDQVAGKLRAALQEQGEAAWAANRLQELRRDASIQVTDPILYRQYDQAHNPLKIGPPLPPR